MKTAENTNKKIGDWVHLYGNQFYKIKSDPFIFKSNRLATPDEVADFKERTKLTNDL